jgi:hypothetical protein
MRAQSIYESGGGNSYRYHRAVKKVADIEERKAHNDKWNDLYKKAAEMAQKDSESDEKAKGNFPKENISDSI